MQISKENKLLIQDIIRENPKFKGNEDLIEVFCEAIYKKSYLLIDAIRDTKRLRRHLYNIGDDCIDQVIRDRYKFNKSPKKNQYNKNENIISVKKSPLNDDESLQKEFFIKKNNNIINLKEEIQRSEKYDSVDGLIDPLEYSPKKRVSEHTVEKLIEIIKNIDSKFPKKRYYEIFNLRYIRRYNQMEIAREMKISQVELSKRFVELIKLTRENS